MVSDLKIIYTTFEDEEEAVAVCRTLVEERLVACANILGAVRSIYRWEGKVTDEGEVAILMKTSAAQAKVAMARIEELHSYDTPGIEIWGVEDAPKAFSDWIKSETS